LCLATGAYKVAVSNRKRPTTIALSRQGMPNLPNCSIEGVEKGAYVIHDSEGTPDMIIIGTGSELPMAIDAAKKLEADGAKVSHSHTLPHIHASLQISQCMQRLSCSWYIGAGCLSAHAVDGA